MGWVGGWLGQWVGNWLGGFDSDAPPTVEDVGGTGHAKRDDSLDRLKRFHKNRRDQQVADATEEEELILLLFMSQDN